MIKIGVYFLFACFFFASCKQEANSCEQNEIMSNDAAMDTIIEKDVSNKELVSFEDYLADFVQRKKAMELALQQASPKEANTYYIEFRKQNQQFCEKLTAKEAKMLDNYQDLYGDIGLYSSGKYASKIKQLMKNGLEVFYIGEGYSEIRVRPSEYEHLFSGFLTDDYEAFMQNTLLDDQYLMVSDAGLAISYEELERTINRWYYFIQQFPNSATKKEAKASYAEYQLWFVLGMDNSPVFEDYETGSISDEMKREFLQYGYRFDDEITKELIAVVVNSQGNYESKYAAVLKKQAELLKKL